MNTALLIGVFAYEIIVIVGLGLWLQRRHAKQAASIDEFALAGRDLPVPVVAVTLALTVLGTCLLYTSPSPRDQRGSRMPSSA